jgi:hypothetical protein
MVVALGFAIVVAVGASLERPMEVAAANAATSGPKPATGRSSAPTPASTRGWRGTYPHPSRKSRPNRRLRLASPSGPAVDPQPASVPIPAKQPKPQPEQQKATTSTGDNDPLQTREQTHPASHARHYHLHPGAIMSLTIPSVGLENAPVIDSVTTSALDRGVVHLPDTSLPWSDTGEERLPRRPPSRTARHRKPPRLLPPQRADGRGKGQPSRPKRQEVRLQGAGELHCGTPGQLSNGQGKGPRPFDAADVHADTDPSEPFHRPSRKKLVSTLRPAAYACQHGVTHLVGTLRPTSFACQHAC